MKKLDDLSLFEDDYLPRIACGQSGMHDYYRRNNREVRMFDLPYLPNELFYAIALFEMNSRGGTHYRRTGGDFFSLEYVRAGKLYARQDGRGYLLEPGDLFLMQPGAENEYKVGRDDFCEKSSIAVSGLLLEAFLEKSGLRDKDVLEKVDEVRLAELFAHFKALGGKSGLESAGENSRQTYRLLQFLRNPAPVSVASGKIRAAVEYMEKHFSRAVTLADLSEICGYSPPHLTRSFHKIHGVSPHQMLLQLRMKHASLLLLNEPKLSVKEIAARAGYARPLNFSAEFRRRYGLSPSQYRRYYRIDGEILRELP